MEYCESVKGDEGNMDTQHNNIYFSNYMFRNARLGSFIEFYLKPIMTFWINKVKYLRIFYNFGVPKDYQKIN